MNRITTKLRALFNKHSTKIDKTMTVVTDAYGAFAGFFAMAALETVTHTSSSPLSIPLAAAAAVAGGIYVHNPKLPERISAAFGKALEKGGPAATGASLSTTSAVAMGVTSLPAVAALPILGAAAVVGGVVGHKKIPKL